MVRPGRSRWPIAFAVTVPLLVVVLSTAWAMWGIDRSLRVQRSRLLQAVQSATGEQAVVKYAESFWSGAGSPSRQPPELLRDAGIHYAEPLRLPDGTVDAIALHAGGADNHFGLIVSRSGDGPPRSWSLWPIRRQITSGVWYYDELGLQME